VVAGLLTACSGGEAPVIEVGAVSTATVVEVVDAPAEVTAKASSAITSPATGHIRSLMVRDGQKVREGQVLVVIDSPETEQTLARAQQAAASASTSVDLTGIDVAASQARAAASAQRAFAQARRAAEQIPDPTLRQQSLAQISQAEAQYQAAASSAVSAADQVNSGVSSLEQALNALTRAQQVQAQIAVEAAQSAVDALTVRAPIAGTVVFGAGASGSPSSGLSGLVDQLPSSVAGQASSLLGGSPAPGGSTTGTLDVGSVVSTGDPMLTITDVSTLSLTGEVDETDVLLVKPGVKADVELDAVPGASYRGVVRNVDLNPTTSGRGGVGYVVRLDLFGGTTAEGTVAPTPRPGMSAVAALKVLTAKNAVAVPAAAVFRDGNRDAVWLVVDGVASKQDVTLGAQGDELLQVTEGVAVGDQIVVRGADQVRAGQAVP
ncbi:MAG: efflux RND transporter periplasmic adaptor subunit, partial [Actinomycetes bacterium]